MTEKDTAEKVKKWARAVETARGKVIKSAASSDAGGFNQLDTPLLCLCKVTAPIIIAIITATNRAVTAAPAAG